MSRPVLAPVRSTFRALAATIVPEAGSLAEDEWQELEAIVEDYLARRPPRLRRQLRLFVHVLGALPGVRWGRSFQALDPARRTAFLAAVQDAPALLLRRGFWGVRTMVYLGYYSRAAAAAEIGYRANAAGWEARP